MNDLDQAIYDTVRYFDLFDMPLTATQVWQCLIIDPGGAQELRWGGHGYYRLGDIQRRLRESDSLKEKLDMKWGYYSLQGKEKIVRSWLDRHAIAQQKWKIARRSARFLALVPFVQSLAGSGSLAVDNTDESSDLDMFVITTQERIWTARLGLLIVAQLLGRRRKYWNVKAPDKLCLNHYVTNASLAISPAARNVYTAVQYTLHVPIFGNEPYLKFQSVNAGWIHQYVMNPPNPEVSHAYTFFLPGLIQFIKNQIEKLFLEPIGDALEAFARTVQLRAIAEHHPAGVSGRVVTTEEELAFHPDTKVPGILYRYYQDPGQQALL